MVVDDPSSAVTTGAAAAAPMRTVPPLPSSTIQVLRLVHDYQQELVHHAHFHFKACLWNITKARHRHASMELPVAMESYCTASNVRWEGPLEPHLRVRVKQEEEAPSQTSTTFDAAAVEAAAPGTSTTHLSLVWTKDHHSNNHSHNKTEPTAEPTKRDDEIPDLHPEEANLADESMLPSEQTGLRQRRRRNKDATDNQTSTTTGTMLVVTEQEQEPAKSESQPPLASSCSPTGLMDPLELLAGALPPKELHRAQQEARVCLQSYLQAANCLVKLQEHLGQCKQTQMKKNRKQHKNSKGMDRYSIPFIALKIPVRSA